MKRKITIALSILMLFAVLSIALPESIIAQTTSTVANAQLIDDNYYTDEQGEFRVMVRVTKDNAKIRDNPFFWSKVISTAKKGELYNYRGNLFGYYNISRGMDIGTDLSNYSGHLSNKDAEVVKLYNDGTIVIK